MATQSKQSAALTSPGYLVPFIIVAALFFIFGFITTLNMALVPHLRSIFNLHYGPAMLAESAFFLAYFVFSSPSAKLIEMIGYKQTMVVSLFIQVVGCLLFVPAARLVNFPLFLRRSSSWARASPLCRLRPIRMSRSWDPRTAPLSPDPGAGSQLARRHHRAAGCRRVHSDRPPSSPLRPRSPTPCAVRTSRLPPGC